MNMSVNFIITFTTVVSDINIFVMYLYCIFNVIQNLIQFNSMNMYCSPLYLGVHAWSAVITESG